MGYRLGIDLGASTTTAVLVRDGEGTTPCVLGEDTVAMPTELFLDSSGIIHCGSDAAPAAAAAPERLLRNFVELIGSGEPVRIGPAPRDAHHPQDIAAALVAWVIARVTGEEGAAPTSVALAHPAGWDGHRVELLQRALTAQKLDHVRLVAGHFAAGRLFTSIVGPRPGEAFAVFQLAATGVTAAVLRADLDGNVWPMGRPEYRAGVAGNAFDAALLTHVFETMDVPVDPERLASPDPAVAAMLAACRQVKERLSTDEVTGFAIAGQDDRTELEVRREDFEARISPILAEAVDVLAAAVAGAGIDHADLGAVLLSGGSAAIPVVARALAERFDSGVTLVRESAPALTVAAGAALGLPAPVETGGRLRPAATSEPTRPARAVPQPATSTEPTEEPARPAAMPKARSLKPALVGAGRGTQSIQSTQRAPQMFRPSAPQAAPAPERIPTSSPDVPPSAPGAPAGPRPDRGPIMGTGRPIRSHEAKGAPRRDHARLLGLDVEAAQARSATAVLCVIPGRELGTVDDLVGVPAARHLHDMRRSSLPQEEPLEELEAEWSEIEDHIVDERSLGQRARAMLTPGRLLVLSAFTSTVVVGTGAWLQAH